ncbi:MAG: hypothetical protein RR531_02050 [Longicatena sp.]
MRIDHIRMDEITYKKQEYSPALLESLKRIGLNFPIRVRMRQDGYECSDGNKRLSAIEDILNQDPDCPRFQTINVIIEEHARTAAPHSLHNHH